jgi:hypothetical protein
VERFKDAHELFEKYCDLRNLRPYTIKYDRNENSAFLTRVLEQILGLRNIDRLLFYFVPQSDAFIEDPNKTIPTLSYFLQNIYIIPLLSSVTGTSFPKPELISEWSALIFNI